MTAQERLGRRLELLRALFPSTPASWRQELLQCSPPLVELRLLELERKP